MIERDAVAGNVERLRADILRIKNATEIMRRLLRHTDGEAVFYVRDNGMGMAPQYHEQVFGLFERLNAEIEGTGIGLTLVKRIVELNGGRLWVESEGEGQGCAFCFTLAEAGAEPATSGSR